MVGPSHRALNTRIPRVRGGEGKGWGGLKFTRISIHGKQAIAIRPLFAATLSEQISGGRVGGRDEKASSRLSPCNDAKSPSSLTSFL